MKHLVTLVVSVLVLASCSTPKYTYNFDYYDYNSGRKKAEAEKLVAQNETVTPATIEDEASPLKLTPNEVVASAREESPAPVAKPVAAKKYTEMSKTEKKEFRNTVKKEFKTYLKVKKGDGTVGKETQALDYNLKMAIIFGAVALTLSFFGGVNSVFWIASVIALVIGVVFFIKWIAEQ
jgi:hypothetical protein